MAEKNNFNITNLVNNGGCFDLQFRKDTRHKRLNAPTYYRWKIQFVITCPKEGIKNLKKVKNIIGCGKVHVTKNQARFSVQKINDIVDFVLPFIRKNNLSEKKKKDFQLWQKAVDIIYQNKGKYIIKWKRNDLMHLMEIHKLTSKYKNKPRQAKWIQMAKLMTETL